MRTEVRKNKMKNKAKKGKAKKEDAPKTLKSGLWHYDGSFTLVYTDGTRERIYGKR